jgi:DNA uptake protein ComE-like DNA-binding protein
VEWEEQNGAVSMRFRLLLLAAGVVCIVGAGIVVAGSSASAEPVYTPVNSRAKAHERAVPPPEARVDINHASVDELLRVPGMTRTWAGRIARFRPYHSKQDLLDRGVVNSAVYDRIKDYVIAHRDKQ